MVEYEEWGFNREAGGQPGDGEYSGEARSPAAAARAAGRQGGDGGGEGSEAEGVEGRTRQSQQRRHRRSRRPLPSAPFRCGCAWCEANPHANM